ncbi:GMP synthase-like glutamine amidotransferase [Bradyrhizobium sp. LB11.1]
MAVAHRYQPTYGVQFHPESILTQQGHVLLTNFLQLARLPAHENRKLYRAGGDLTHGSES